MIYVFFKLTGGVVGPLSNTIISDNGFFLSCDCFEFFKQKKHCVSSLTTTGTNVLLDVLTKIAF
jgi:hypothetical protein